MKFQYGSNLKILMASEEVNMKFLSIKGALPGRRITNAEIIERIIHANKATLSEADMKALVRQVKFFFQVAGTESRFVREDHEDASTLIVDAGMSALRSARIDPKDIDLLIYVGIGRGFLEPSTANIFQDRLQLSNATCFDLLDACASWLRAVHVAKAFLENGAYRNIMILNGEFMHKENIESHLRFESLNELEHRFAMFTIGEAATATILSDSQDDDEYYASFKTFGQLRNLCMIPFPNVAAYNCSTEDANLKPFNFYSYSNKLINEGTELMIEHYNNDPEINRYNYDICFSHAASDAATQQVYTRCSMRKEAPLIKTHCRFGNTISTSVPLAMSIALEEEKLKADDRIVIGVASAGLTTAWARFRFLT
jgi:3-oxoacyl-[acyl-carrier-protein] synthase III